jgi:hypothetical protein
MAEALKIQKKPRDQFESVDFVHHKTPHQLKVIIRGIWRNIHEIATELDDSHPEVAEVLDNLLDGRKINTNDLRERYQYFEIGEAFLEYNSSDNTMRVIDRDGDTVVAAVEGFDLKIMKATHKKTFKDFKKR